MSSQKSNHILHNNIISAEYRDFEFYLMLSDFKSALAYWVVRQNNNDKEIIVRPLKAFTFFLKMNYFKKKDDVIKFTYNELSDLISEETFIKVPEILKLNKTEPDFIDLGALARNVFFYDSKRTNNTTIMNDCIKRYFERLYK